MNRLWKLAWLAMSLVTIGHALDPQKAISQFVHTVWTDREGDSAEYPGLGANQRRVSLAGHPDRDLSFRRHPVRPL